MGKRRNKAQIRTSPPKWKHEWHLYSAVAVTASLTFVVFQFSTGTPQNIGVALSALVATFLFASASWKEASIETHQWVICFSMVGAILAGFLFWLFTDGIKKLTR